MPEVIIDITYQTMTFSSPTHAVAMIPGIGSKLRSMYAGDVYASGKPLNRIKYQSRTESLKPKKFVKTQIQSTIVVQLGGPFQEIGGVNENAGGGYQKLG